MAKKITRTVSFTRILCTQVVVENGQPKLVPGKDLILCGVSGLTRDKATVILRQEYSQDYSVVDIIEETARYEMTLEDFVAYGHKVQDVPPGMVPPDDKEGDDEDDDDVDSGDLDAADDRFAATEGQSYPEALETPQEPFPDTDNAPEPPDVSSDDPSYFDEPPLMGDEDDPGEQEPPWDSGGEIDPEDLL